MKICFVSQHKYWGGIQNNGGSKTIIRSAETLKELGHKVVIWTHTNKYTWHKPKVKITPHLKGTKKFDAAIAVSVSDIDIVNTYFGLKVNKFWWARGIEKWQMPKNKIVKKARKIKVIVNATHLLKHFPKAKVCYAGLDLDWWKNYGIACYIKDKATFGCLYSKRHKTKRYDLFKKIQKPMSDKMHAEFKKLNGHLNDKQLRQFYNQCDIWFAPTELEGFHNVPAEACLCGCLVVCNRRDSNGMGDYATEDTAMRYTGYDELLEAIENPDFSKIPKMQKLLREKIGSREKNMKRFVELIK